MSSEDDITIFHNPHILKSELKNNERCRLKVLWISPQSLPCSLAFPKNSPILPFFNYVYHQLAETGIKNGYYKRWIKSQNSACHVNEISGMTLKKTTLLFVVLGGGIILSFFLLATEILKRKKALDFTNCLR